jgi:hypothetical protein
MARRRFTRRKPDRTSKRVILIATEGEKTEPIYLDELKRRYRDVVTVIVSGGRDGESNPKRVLSRLFRERKKMAHWDHNRDGCWLVVDTDAWKADEKEDILNEAKKDSVLHLAISNPCFEVWLFLHFREAWRGITAKRLESELAKTDCLGRYEKNDYPVMPLMERTGEAIDRARKADTSRPEGWPGEASTRMYLLVEDIMKG